MKKVYTDDSLMKCGTLQSLLEANDIPCFLKNEAVSGVFGGGCFNPYHAYPELWVEDDDFDKAKELISQEIGTEPDDV
jgi:hypothetical protein